MILLKFMSLLLVMPRLVEEATAIPERHREGPDATSQQLQGPQPGAAACHLSGSAAGLLSQLTDTNTVAVIRKRRKHSLNISEQNASESPWFLHRKHI